MRLLFLLFFAVNLSLQAESLVQRGTGLLEYGIFNWDLYNITLFAPKEADAEQIINGNFSSRMEIIYERSISKKYLNMGWEAGLKENLGESFDQYGPQYQWLTENTHDVKKGDILAIHVDRPGDEVTLYLNGKQAAKRKDKDLAKIIFLPWIGPNAVDLKLKNKLLNLH